MKGAARSTRAALIILLVAIAAFPVAATAARHHAATTATTSIAAGSDGTYLVVFDGDPTVNQYDLWVSQTCADTDGTTVSAEYHPVIWDGTAGTTDPFTRRGDTCTAFVSLFPDVWTPVSNVLTL